MSILWEWSAISVEGSRFLIFSKRFNRLYLLSNEQAADKQMYFLLGLKKVTKQSRINDSAERVAHNFSNLSKSERSKPPLSLVIAYRFLQNTRFVPMSVVLRILRLAARVKPKSNLDRNGIGKLIHHVEFNADLSNCYPRALLTAYLCLRHLRYCEFYIGTIAPTRLMHAWCVVDGVIPYEHLNEHFLYQPMLKVTMSI